MKVPVGASIKYCEYRCTTYNAHRSQHLRSLYLTSAPHPRPQHDWWPSSGDAFSITTIHSRYSYGPLKNSCQAEIISRLVQKFIQCILVHIVLHFSPSLLRLREWARAASVWSSSRPNPRWRTSRTARTGSGGQAAASRGTGAGAGAWRCRGRGTLSSLDYLCTSLHPEPGDTADTAVTLIL